MDKKELNFKFSKEWEKHYNLETFKKYGFKRQICKKCGRAFWSIIERNICGDPSCSGYSFIGNPIGIKREYVETWKAVEKYFVDNGHTSIKPFPTVARWRDDLYFTIASINNFQPYVVNGELEPIANPLIVPQPCIRFSDIENVGVTGRHYTNFVMIGQHAFNKEKLFYWKEEAIDHDIQYLTKVLGIPLEEIVFHEDVWIGGGNFGPSLEYFVRGLELGNCVFMQYQETPTGYKELNTKVIDMGAGLSRLAWITNGNPTSYEIVFKIPYEYLKKEIEIDYDEYLRFSKIAGSLNIDEIDKQTYKNLIKDFDLKKIEQIQAIFAILDHTSTLLFTIKDGMFPSNSGGGYNLRVIARRMFNFIEKYNWELDFYKILELHIENWRGLFDEYSEGIDITGLLIEEEYKRYKANKEKIQKIINKYKGKNITEEQARILYESEGVPKDMIKEYFNIDIEVKETSKQNKKDIVLDFPETVALYYDNIDIFEATVIGIYDNMLILDKTGFYPESGGQVGDTGFINGIRVLDTKKFGNVIGHIMERMDFKIGEKVIGKVDLARRYEISKHHTAAHILTKACYEILGKHVWQAGAYKGENEAHMDITHYKRLEFDEIQAIERRVNEIIWKKYNIEIEVLPRNIAEQKYGFRIYQGGAVPGKHLRVVKIGDYDIEVCGGTHNMLNNTSEIGFFKITKSKSISDGVQRIYFKVGKAALDYIQYLEKELSISASYLKTDIWNLGKTAIKFFEEWKKIRK